MDRVRELLTTAIGRLAFFLSKWATPALIVLAIYKIYTFLFVKDWNAIIVKSIKKGDLASVQEAIKNGADIEFKDASETTPLMLAVKSNNSALVGVLLSAGAKVDARDEGGKTALLFAARRGCIDIVQALLVRRADPNIKCYEGTTPIIVASCKFQFARQLYLFIAHLLIFGD